MALPDAWLTGAESWGAEQRREFANDPLNLLAVEASLNRQKGAGDAATWLPPKRDYRCEYVGRQIAVKSKYGLWVKPAEADAMEHVLEGCEGFLAVVDEVPWPAAGAGDVVATEAEPAKEPPPRPDTGADAEGGHRQQRRRRHLLQELRRRPFRGCRSGACGRPRLPQGPGPRW